VNIKSIKKIENSQDRAVSGKWFKNDIIEEAMSNEFKVPVVNE